MQTGDIFTILGLSGTFRVVDPNPKDGAYNIYWINGDPHIKTFYKGSKLHGEFKKWASDGKIDLHCFFVDGEYHSFKKLPYPETPEDLMYFKLKYDLQLLGD